MLDYYFPQEERRTTLEHNYLSSFIEEAAYYYSEQSYHAPYAKHCLLSMSYFGNWLQEERIPLNQVNMEHARDFLKQFTPPMFIHQPYKASTQRRGQDRAAVGYAVSLVRQKHFVAINQSFQQIEVNKYVDHLRQNRGLTDGTIYIHQYYLREFLEHCFTDGNVNIADLSATYIYEYVDSLPITRRNSIRRFTCTALCGYLKFLQLHGISTGHLVSAVPVVHTLRTALSPNTMISSDLKKLLDSVDRSKATGKRNYAAILCMCDLGMRVSDVARLSLDDIDWKKGSVRVANHKKNRPYWLPLPKRLGEALVDYITDGRPSSQFREIFLRHARPVGTPATVHSIKTAIQRIWDCSEMHDRFSGTHILRHSAATRMKQNGVALKSIADVLGHSSLQTTTLYVQVDLPVLRKTAQPWPGGDL